MMTEIEATGKTVEDAIDSAIQKLNTGRDEISVEILEEPTKGFLGIGTREAKVRVTLKNASIQKAKFFLQNVFETMNLTVDMAFTENEKSLSCVLTGTDMGIIIGRGGETLDALQYLTSLYMNKGNEKYTRVQLDTENYRQKREETLTRLANKMAERVLKFRKSVTLEPMNPNERRIIHATLHDSNTVTTYSVGEEPYRKVVVTLKNRTSNPRTANSRFNQRSE